MMPLNHILRKCTAGYKVSRSQEKINQLMYMEDIKLFGIFLKKNWKLYYTQLEYKVMIEEWNLVLKNVPC